MLKRVLLVVFLCMPLLAPPVRADEPAKSDPLAMLRGSTWQWTGLTDPMSKTQIAEPARYTLAFTADGAVQIRADCNRASGTYTAAADGSVSIRPGPTTLAACPPESFSDRFLSYLANVSHYYFRDAHLLLNTTADDGTLEFLPDEAVHFQCDDGIRIAVLFSNGEPPTAQIYTDADSLLLTQTPAASGARYANGETTLWTKGQLATYVAGGKTSNCTAISGTP